MASSGRNTNGGRVNRVSSESPPPPPLEEAAGVSVGDGDGDGLGEGDAVLATTVTPVQTLPGFTWTQIW